MANTLIKVNILQWEGADVPAGTPPLNFEEQLLSKGRFTSTWEADGETYISYEQYTAHNKDVKVKILEDYADILAALETTSDFHQKFEVDVLSENGNPVNNKQIIGVNNIIRVMKNTENVNHSDIWYDNNVARTPTKLTVSQDMEEILVISRSGYYSGGVASELL